jgi:phospholipase C
MFVISPWSKGGWVSSEVFDHTSLIRFVQARFGNESAPLTNPNITAWREAVCGDLTSAFNFAAPNDATVTLPSTAAYIPPNNEQDPASYIPLPPVVQTLPVQESGTRHARAVPYSLNVASLASLTSEIVTLTFSNTGARTAVFQVRSENLLQAPRSYTVSPEATLTDTWEFAADDAAAYDLSVYGPNGFFRHYRGAALNLTATNLESKVEYDTAADGVTLAIKNVGGLPVTVQVQNVYTGAMTAHTVATGATFSSFVSLAQHAGWYDFILTAESDPNFQQQLAGHLENGEAGTTDPAIG